MSVPVAVAAQPILVIEDEPSVMAFIRAALERSGYRVTSAPTGAEALGLLQSGSFAGVISDMRTPGGVDGAHIWEWLRANRPELLARLIFITGDIANEDTAATLQRTGAPVLEKPFRVQRFLEVVEEILGRER